MASSASTEQWIFTGGKDNSSTISTLLNDNASSIDLFFTHSVASEDAAIADYKQKNDIN